MILSHQESFQHFYITFQNLLNIFSDDKHSKNVCIRICVCINKIIQVCLYIYIYRFVFTCLYASIFVYLGTFSICLKDYKNVEAFVARICGLYQIQVYLLSWWSEFLHNDALVSIPICFFYLFIYLFICLFLSALNCFCQLKETVEKKFGFTNYIHIIYISKNRKTERKEIKINANYNFQLWKNYSCHINSAKAPGFSIL